MISEAISKDLRQMVRRAASNNPMFVIYVGIETYRELKRELTGEFANFAIGYPEKNKFMGHRLYRTLDHEDWKIFQIEDCEK